jgi:hypothetical protein
MALNIPNVASIAASLSRLPTTVASNPSGHIILVETPWGQEEVKDYEQGFVNDSSKSFSSLKYELFELELRVQDYLFNSWLSEKSN